MRTLMYHNRHNAVELRLRDTGVLEAMRNGRCVWRNTTKKQPFGQYNAVLNCHGALTVNLHNNVVWSSKQK
jgi:hypothetical protein